MRDYRLLTFKHLLEPDSTDTIDFTRLISEDVTGTGSFDLRWGGVKALGKLLNSLPIPVFLVDHALSIQFANSACARMDGGYLQLSGSPFCSMLPNPEERHEAESALSEVFNTRRPRITEACLQIRDNKISGRMHFRSLRVGEERCILVLVEDLTQEKQQLLEKARQHEELERRVAERTAELTRANDLLKKEVEERKRAEQELLTAREELEQRVIERTAELKEINDRLLMEIAHRVEAEKTSVKLEDRFRTIFQHSLDVIVVANTLDGTIISANEALETILGFRPEDVIGQHISILNPPEGGSSTPSALDHVKPHGAVFEAHRVKRADGDIVPVDLTATVIPWEGGTAILATFRDVRDREEALAALRESEERYRALFDQAGSAILLETEDGKILDANLAASRLTGYANAELMMMKMGDLLPGWKLSGRDWADSGWDSNAPLETVAVRRDATQIPVEVNVAPLRMAKQTLYLSIIHDIGDRKRAENLTLAQRDLSTRLSAVSDLTEALQLCMETTLQVSGMDAAAIYSPGKEEGLDLAAHHGLPKQCAVKMSRLRPNAMLFRLIMNGEPIYSTCRELGLLDGGLDGQGYFGAMAVLPVLYEGQVIACLGIASRSMDEVPVVTRNALEAIIAQIGSAIARIRAEGALLEAHQELEKRVESRTRELVEANVRLEQEIAQRKTAEMGIRKSLKEKEALLQEVHHRVKNNLQIISSLLALQRTQVQDEKAMGVLRDSQGRIRSMAFIHEHLYKSPELSRIDFTEYIKDLVGALLQSYSEVAARIKLTLDLDPVFLGVSTALPCGLVLNEVVSNCLKHAFPSGRQGEIRIQLRHRGEREYEIGVIDDGVGFPEDLDYRTSQSLGLRLVNNLTELQLRGRLEVRADRGTAVWVTFEDQEAYQTRRER